MDFFYDFFVLLNVFLILFFIKILYIFGTEFFFLKLMLLEMRKNILLIFLIFVFSQVFAQKPVAQSEVDSLEKARRFKVLGSAFAAKCKTDSMFFYYSKALDIYRQIGDTAGMSSVVTYIGVAYKDLGFKKSAKGYFRRALRYDSLQNDYLKMAVDFQHWSELTEDKNEAVGYLKKSIAISDTIKDKNAVDVKSHGYKSLAMRFLEFAYDKNDKTYADSCAECLKKLENYEFIKYKDKSYLEVQLVRTRYLIFIEKYKDALEVLTAADKNSDSEKWDKISFVEYYRLLSEAYEKAGDYRNALANYKIYDSCQSKIVSDSVVSAMVNYKTERVLKYRQYKTLKEKESQRIILIVVVASLVLLSLVIFYIVRTISIRRRAATAIDRQNEMLDTQQSEINSQRSIISRYGHDVEFFSQQLYDAIHYAERIQKVANSSTDEFKKLFPDSFVYYSPRDIASGDFYHVFECGKYSVLVVGDCTGYGVQGAMLSLLCLSEIGRICALENVSPAGVVEGIKHYLKSVLPGNSNVSSTDGIVLSVFFFDFSALELRFAAVNQTACILRGSEIIRLKGNHVSFGGDLNGKRIAEHTVKIKKGDMLYAFTDGILSQPGGGDVNDRNGKKFLTANLDKVLKKVCSKDVQEQCNSIKQCITDWRKGRPQIDDITIVGVRV